MDLMSDFYVCDVNDVIGCIFVHFDVYRSKYLYKINKWYQIPQCKMTPLQSKSPVFESLN